MSLTAVRGSVHDPEAGAHANGRWSGRGFVWLAAEQSRLILWLPVMLAIGVGLYFDRATEPPSWSGPLAMLVAGAAALGLRRRPVAAGLALVGVLIALGFSVAQWRAVRVAAPVITARWGPAELTGRVIAVEVRAEGRRLILDQLSLPGLEPARVPARIRIKLREGSVAPITGERIAVRAQLVPPPVPVVPGGYDFARWAWFERLGAVGSARGALRVLSRDDVGAWRLWLVAARTALVERVLALDPGPAGQVTAALLTGEMGHIAPELMSAMRDSGLAHLLSISGLHITLVAGIVFFAVRRLLALAPPLALNWPVKKIAAVTAFAAISLYALFAAPGVPTTRAWVMGSIVLLAVLVDRSPVSMRLVAWAAAVIVLTMPEAVLGPSFQMSFAAVLALIATWEVWAPLQRRWREGAGPLLRGGLGLAGMLLTTLVASLATAPFGIYHFNRLAWFGIVANLIAVPLTSIAVMPAAVLVFLLLPFGLEAWALGIMNLGNEFVVAIARSVASWPRAASAWPAMPDWGFVATIGGGVWLCLWTRRWRLLGVPAVVIGMASAWIEPIPDVLASADGRVLAARDDHGGLAMRSVPGAQLVQETWLRRSGLATASEWPRGDGAVLGCTRDLCWVERPGHRVAIVSQARGLATGCREATLLITSLDVWRDCPAPLWLIDRTALRRDGAHALWLGAGGAVQIATVRKMRGARPWTAGETREARK